MSACGHINKHSMDLRGQPDNLSCEKDMGHDGNHGAMHLQHANGVLGESKVWCEWVDAAGTLASEIVPEPLPISEKDREHAAFVRNFVGGDIPHGTQIG